MNRIVPLNDQLIVEVIPTETKTAGGILLTPASVETSCTGVVITPNGESYYRDGSRRNQSQCSRGDVVLFAKNSGTKVIHAPAGKEWLAIPEDCIYYRVEQQADENPS